ncbi:hypothetical protein PQR08_11455 [Caballeronia jiangsuensis]|uniref:Ribbon-helix-helix protein CopG domain-containing protein n=1 Tax=Caballeronia jiangsuensis TaxID=1458357 RepID=A0ABW9CJI3_9BURK
MATKWTEIRKAEDIPEPTEEEWQAQKLSGELLTARARHMIEALRMLERTTQDDIRNGVKTGVATVPMQIRLTKDQVAQLRAAAFVEGRPATAIVRDLLDMYFDAKALDPETGKQFRDAVKLHGSA